MSKRSPSPTAATGDRQPPLAPTDPHVGPGQADGDLGSADTHRTRRKERGDRSMRGLDKSGGARGGGR